MLHHDLNERTGTISAANLISLSNQQKQTCNICIVCHTYSTITIVSSSCYNTCASSTMPRRKLEIFKQQTKYASDILKANRRRSILNCSTTSLALVKSEDWKVLLLTVIANNHRSIRAVALIFRDFFSETPLALSLCPIS